MEWLGKAIAIETETMWDFKLDRAGDPMVLGKGWREGGGVPHAWGAGFGRSGLQGSHVLGQGILFPLNLPWILFCVM